MITTILFDFFGTLVEYTPGSFFAKKRRRTYNFLNKHGFVTDYRTFSQLGEIYKQLAKEAKLTQNEFHMHTVMNTFMKNVWNVIPEEEFIDRLTRVYLREWSGDVYRIPYIHNLLGYLSQKYKLGILSNTHYPSLVRDNLIRLGMDKYFPHVYTSVDYGKRKPHPMVFLDTLKKMNTSVDEVIFVGDSYEEDYLGAKNSNLSVYLIDNQTKYPELGMQRINNLKYLQKLL